MRVEIDIDQDLYDQATTRAQELGCTLDELVSLALAAYLRGSEPPFELVTFGGDGLVDGLTWEAVPDVAADLETERYERGDKRNDGGSA